MISTFLVQHPWLTTAGLVALLVAGPVVAALLRHRRGDAGVLVVLSLLPLATFTLSPGSRQPSTRQCQLAWDLPTLGQIEAIANIDLFISFGLLLAVALRRPLVALLVGSMLSVAIETTQYLVLALGRACDTTDWEMNTIGTAVGAALAAMVLLVMRPAQDS